MTNQKARICRKVVKYKKLDVILEKTGIADYITIQEVLGPGALSFADIEDDQTEVYLSDALLEELERRHRRAVDVWITRILSVAAIIISIIALFRS